MGNKESTLVKLKPKFIPGRNISFGGILEKKMIETFNTFDILWYAPEDSEKLEEWIAFTNVTVQKFTKEEEFINIALLGEMIRRYVIIATGAYAEKTIPKIAKILKLQVIIYCMNVEYHKQWSKNYSIIRGVFTTPAQLFEDLLKLHQIGFGFHEFSYKIISSGEFNLNYYDSLKNTEFILKDNSFLLKLNKYERYLSGCQHEFKFSHLNLSDYFDCFRSDTADLVTFFYGENAILIPGMEYFLAGTIFDKPTKEFNIFCIGLIILSAYFSKLPYLYGILSYDEILNILKQEITIIGLRNDYHEFLNNHLDPLMVKINNEKASILEEFIHLKFLQTFLIKHTKFI